MTRPLLIIIILISINSCKQSDAEKTEKLEMEKNLKTRKDTTHLTQVAESYVNNDSLIIMLNSELEKITQNKNFTVEKEPIKNRHVENLTDTIVTRTFENTRLISYKTTGKEWVYNANIENSEFALNEFIKVGSKKNIVEKFLSVAIQNDILKIGNLEQTSKYILKFESGNLKTIEFIGYRD